LAKSDTLRAVARLPGLGKGIAWWPTASPCALTQTGLKNHACDFLSHAAAHKGKGFLGAEIMKLSIQAERFDSGPSYCGG
jgi:hypothetical protein